MVDGTEARSHSTRYMIDMWMLQCIKSFALFLYFVFLKRKLFIYITHLTLY